MLNGAEEQAQQRGAFRSPFSSAGLFWTNSPVLFHYQPIVSLATREICGAEALIRTRRPSGGVDVPAAALNRLYYFEREKIVDFDRFVISRNLEFLASMHASGCIKRLSINVSGVFFSEKNNDPSVFIMGCLAKVGRPDLVRFVDVEIVEWIEFEINEQVMERVQACRDLGMGICLDDAGTGSVGLDTFVALPFSCIKIDRIFVKKMPYEEKAFYIVKGFTETAKSLNIRVVAEGVETEKQAEILLEIGVDYAQGFYFHPPMSARDLLAKCKIS